MLKAVRFDEEKHKHLLDWIKDFRDAKGKPNESEAVRYLMEMGYESMMTGRQEVRAAVAPDQQPVQAVTESKSEIDRDTLKREMMEEVMAEVNAKMLGGLTNLIDKLGNLQVQPQIIQVPVASPLQKTDTPEEKASEVPKPVRKKQPVAAVEGNALLSNILGNADR